MYKLFTTKTFERKLKVFIKKHPELENEITKILDFLAEDPYSVHLKTHKLSGQLKNERAVYLTYEFRILFLIKDDEIYLTNIGSHDEVY